MKRSPRRSSEIVRVRDGVNEKRCLDCEQWFPVGKPADTDSAFYWRRGGHSKDAWSPRCRGCERLHRSAHQYSTWTPGETVLMPKTPPALTWENLLC